MRHRYNAIRLSMFLLWAVCCVYMEPGSDARHDTKKSVCPCRISDSIGISSVYLPTHPLLHCPSVYTYIQRGLDKSGGIVSRRRIHTMTWDLTSHYSVSEEHQSECRYKRASQFRNYHRKRNSISNSSESSQHNTSRDCIMSYNT